MSETSRMSGVIDYSPSLSVSDAIASRRSLRAFLPDDVPQTVVESILQAASRAPSGTNIQPWNVYVVKGSKRTRLCEIVSAAFDDPDIKPENEVSYYPDQWFEPYLGRRREVGWALYGLLGIGKGERERTHAQHKRNFQFFDAPIGLIFTIHRDLSTGSWLDYGMYLQNIMLLAREQGLHTCAQAAWAEYHPVIRTELPIPENHIVVCGMAIGKADPHAVENELVTTRVAIKENVTFLE